MGTVVHSEVVVPRFRWVIVTIAHFSLKSYKRTHAHTHLKHLTFWMLNFCSCFSFTAYRMLLQYSAVLFLPCKITLKMNLAFCVLLYRYGVTPENIILYGQSIGTVPTIDLAARYECAAVILHSPLMSGLRVAFPDTRKTYCFDAFPRWVSHIASYMHTTATITTSILRLRLSPSFVVYSYRGYLI